MADILEKDLNSSTITVDGDYFRMIDINDVSVKNNFADVASALLVNYEDTSLGGTTRSVQAAINDIAGQTANLNRVLLTQAQINALATALGQSY